MTIVAQIQNLRSFVTSHLSDTVDLNRHVHDDPHMKTTGDIAYVEIRTPYNTYKMAVGSAYAEPPSGAPNECRSLGWVTFHHVGEDKYILGPKNDLTYQSIAKYLNVRELTDAIAAGRREMAEASGTKANEAWIRLKETATRAEKWGIKANLPEAPKSAVIIAPDGFGENEPVDLRPGAIIEHMRANEHPNSPAALAPFVGAQIVYYGNDRIAGMDQVPGVLVKIQHDGRCAAFLMADLNEITFMDNIHRRGSDAGNGRVHMTGWDFNPAWVKEQERIAALESRIHALESAAREKPRRGRPPKAVHEAEETEGAELASELDPPRESEQAA